MMADKYQLDKILDDENDKHQLDEVLDVMKTLINKSFASAT